MLYRRLGRTDLQVSEISLGSSPLPDPEPPPGARRPRRQLHRHVPQLRQREQRTPDRPPPQGCRPRQGPRQHEIPRHGQGHRRVHRRFRSQAACAAWTTETIDVLTIHGAESAGVLVDERVLTAYEQLKKEGAYRFRGLSCHVNHDEVVRKAVDCGLYDMVQVGYNVFDIQETSGEVETYPDYLGASGLRGLLDAGPFPRRGDHRHEDAQGRRPAPGPGEDTGPGRSSIFQAMLKWVLDDSRVASAVTEILNEPDGGGPRRRRDEADRGREEDAGPIRPEKGKDYCHGCARCRRACPAGVATTAILHALAYEESYGKSGQGPGRLRGAQPRRRDRLGLPGLRCVRKGMPLRCRRPVQGPGSRAAPGLKDKQPPVRSARRSRSSGRTSGRSG